MSKLKKVIAAVMAAMMIFTMTACKDTTWSVKNGETTIPVGVYIYYQNEAISNATQKVPSDSQDMFKETIEEKDAVTWINDETKRLMNEHVVIVNKFDEMGLTFSEEEIKQIDVTLNNSWDSYQDYYESMGISKSSAKIAIESMYKYNKVFNAIYGEGGTQEVKESEVKNYLDDNYARVKYIAIQLKDGEGNLFKSAQKAEAKKMAEDYISRSEDESFNNLIDEYTDFYNGEINKATDKDNSSEVVSSKSTEESDYNYETILTKNTESPSKEVVEKAFSMKASNKPVLIEEDEVYYILQKLDIKERNDLVEDQKESIINEMKQQEFKDSIKEWGKALNLEYNEDAVKKYDPITMSAKSKSK